MQSQESGVHYSRWDSSSRDEVSMTAMSSSEEASCYRRYSPNGPVAPTVLTSFAQAQPLCQPTQVPMALGSTFEQPGNSHLQQSTQAYFCLSLFLI